VIPLSRAVTQAKGASCENAPARRRSSPIPGVHLGYGAEDWDAIDKAPTHMGGKPKRDVTGSARHLSDSRILSCPAQFAILAILLRHSQVLISHAERRATVAALWREFQGGAAAAGFQPSSSLQVRLIDDRRSVEHCPERGPV
jgi:hypothetical protein